MFPLSAFGCTSKESLAYFSPTVLLHTCERDSVCASAVFVQGYLRRRQAVVDEPKLSETRGSP